MQSFKLTLASQSPRRNQLLSDAGYDFVVIKPDESAEGSVLPHETPAELVMRHANQKAANVAPRVSTGFVIGCDTVAECEGQILGKPRDRADAERMLRLMRAKVHHVYSGICLWHRPDDRRFTRSAATKLRMSPLSTRHLEQYLDTGAWQGKAGGFGFQDELNWIEIVAGSESNVVGLPLEVLEKMLQEFDQFATTK